MRVRGINYDTGFSPAGRNSRQLFEPTSVGREMRIIADELHSDAVRITGGDPDRLSVAAEHAGAVGHSSPHAPWSSPAEPTAIFHKTRSLPSLAASPTRCW